MANTETLEVTLPVDLLAQVREAVQGGEYESSNEIIRNALEQWSTARPQPVHDVEEMRRLWQEALDDDGPYVPMDEVMDRLEAKYKALAVEQEKCKA